jgi:hypothetical protein
MVIVLAFVSYIFVVLFLHPGRTRVIDMETTETTTACGCLYVYSPRPRSLSHHRILTFSFSVFFEHLLHAVFYIALEPIRHRSSVLIPAVRSLLFIYCILSP